jgi:hypothetical protein
MELSLKLYHGYDLRLGYQQLIAEAPKDFNELTWSDPNHSY